MNKNPCRNCHGPHASRARGLCYRCYVDEQIRCRFPPLCSYGVHFVDFDGSSLGPKRRTKFLPGSKKKIELLRKRSGRLENLWHGEDARRDLG